MSFDTNWDIDKYKENTENVIQWYLRKSFIQTHKNKYEKNLLIAYSKVFENMEFLPHIYGSVYRTECISLVKKLAEQVPAIIVYRNPNTVKNISPTASDTNNNEPKSNNSTNVPYEDLRQKLNEKNLHKSDKANLPTSLSKNDSAKKQINKKPHVKGEKRKIKFVKSFESDVNPVKIVKINHSDPSSDVTKQADLELYRKVRAQPGVKGKVVIFNKTGQDMETLFESFSRLQINLEYITKPSSTPDFKIHQIKAGDEVLSEMEIDFELNMLFKLALCKIALINLRKYCFSVTPKNNFKMVTPESIIPHNVIKNVPKTKTEDPVALERGIGAKIMQQMGWKGTGLGKYESGIKAPIEAASRDGKLGFGNHCVNPVNGAKFFKKYLKNYLEDYINSSEMQPLKFSDKFTKKQRKMINRIVRGLPLKNRAVDFGADATSTIIEKNIDAWKLVEDLIANGGSTNTHTLIKPTNVK